MKLNYQGLKVSKSELKSGKLDLGNGVLHGAVVLRRTFLHPLQEGLVVRSVHLKTGPGPHRKRDQRPDFISTSSTSAPLTATSLWGSRAGAAPRGGTGDKVLQCPTCPTSECGESWTTRCRWVDPGSLQTHTEVLKETGHASANVS